MKLFLIFVALSCLSIATAGIIFEDPAKHSNSNAENKADNKNDNSKDGEEVVLSLDEKNDTVTESEGSEVPTTGVPTTTLPESEGRVRRHFQDDPNVGEDRSYRDSLWWHKKWGNPNWDRQHRGWENGWWSSTDDDWQQALMPRWFCYGRWYYGTKPSFCAEARMYFNNNWDPYYDYKGIPETCVYQFENGPLPWTAAAAHCARQGMRLAVLSTETTQNYAASTFGSKPEYWVGASILNRQRVYSWVTGQPVSPAAWAYGEPNGVGRQNCVQANYGGAGRLDDAECHHAKPFLCQRC